MRIYNGKNSQVDLPLSGNTRVTIAPHSVSKDVMPSDYFLTLVAQSYEADELALIVAGPYEINMCAKNPACTPMVVQSLDEAIERFADDKVELSSSEVVKPVEVKPVEVKPVDVTPKDIKEEEVTKRVVEKPKEEVVIKKLKTNKLKK